MKNIYIFLMISAIIFNALNLFAFPEKRLKWWNARLKKIETRIEKAKNPGGPYSQIADILEKERESAGKIISVLDADKKNNGSLTNEIKIYTDEELSIETDKTLKGIFSIYYLSLYSTEPFNLDNISELKSSVKKELAVHENFISMNDSGILAVEAAEKKISQAEWKRICFETMLSALKSDEEEIYSKLKVSVLKELKKSIAGKESNSREIEDKILALSGKYLSKQEILSCFTIKDSALKNSSDWRLIKNRLTGARNPNDHFIDEYRKQIALNIEYLQYIKNLTAEAVSSATNLKLMQPEFDNAIVKAGNLITAIGESSNLDIRLLPGVVSEDVRKIKEIKRDFNSSFSSIKKEITASYGEYLSEKGVSSKKNIADKKNLNSKIAHFELESILNSAKSYAKYYESLNYSEEIITKLAVVHDILMKDALKGNVTQELDYVIRNNSILGNIDGFNREKFNSELKLKSLIRNDLLAEIKTLNKLLYDYRHSGITINAKPSAEEINDLSGIALKRIEVKIGKIIFNENNLFESDIKAANDLAVILNRNSWGTSDKNSGILFKITEIGSEIRLPYGWIEYAGDSSKGLIREFNDREGKASISINSITLENESLSHASDRWAKDKGFVKIKSRWDEGSSDKYWFQSKTKNYMVVDSYALIKNGKAYIISARCDKNRYQFFKEKLDELVSSAVK